MRCIARIAHVLRLCSRRDTYRVCIAHVLCLIHPEYIHNTCIEGNATLWRGKLAPYPVSRLELYNPASSSFVREYVACMGRRQRRAAPTWLLHPRVVQTAAWLLNASASALIGGATHARRPPTFPTHGFTAAVFALGVCREVRLYGFGEPRGKAVGTAAKDNARCAHKSAYGCAAKARGAQPFWAGGHALHDEHRAL